MWELTDKKRKLARHSRHQFLLPRIEKLLSHSLLQSKEMIASHAPNSAVGPGIYYIEAIFFFSLVIYV